MAQQWYYEEDGVEGGPVSSVELVKLARRGTVNRNTKVRNKPGAEWSPAWKVQGLFDSGVAPLVPSAVHPDAEKEEERSAFAESDSDANIVINLDDDVEGTPESKNKPEAKPASATSAEPTEPHEPTITQKYWTLRFYALIFRTVGMLAVAAAILTVMYTITQMGGLQPALFNQYLLAALGTVVFAFGCLFGAEVIFALVLGLEDLRRIRRTAERDARMRDAEQ
ncbi:DUF4339 domain-containing protein [Calycomorphotria hydatis]|uniref:GYF domain-containing protein n=1 Tax=Calycomorphotria hydatis TaxID=2528027 RepID=A0A517T9M3_9PLAN|nr:DUF4339 domain-containing protein [Calycomorphotria hydatis]QDT65071.1 hypothetical protein V22_23170 [Calycomorphotria hydatis]